MIKRKNLNWIKIIDNFLTKEECLELIDLTYDQLLPATTLGEEIEGYRVASSTWITDNTFLTEKIKKAIANEVNLPIENQEDIHIVKYNIGEQYKNHHDFFHLEESYYNNEIERGGQRLFSCLIYLNDDFTGGETSFPKRNFFVSPKQGKMIIWRNTNLDNSLDYDSLHAGLPVISGEKIIGLIWIRENKFM